MKTATAQAKHVKQPKTAEAVVERLGSERLGAALRVQTEMLYAIHAFMRERGVVQILPVIISPITDPLNHSVYDARISYEGQTLEITKSMILHKQLALVAPQRSGIYCVSPNVRLELPERGGTGRHLLEFSQVDFEFKGEGRAWDVMRFAEDLLTDAMRHVKRACGDDLALLGRDLRVPATPFREFDAVELARERGPDWEHQLSLESKDPVWAWNHEREFYDREDPKRPGSYLNYDIIYPDGFGEGLSGAEREWEHARIVERMTRKKMDLAPYQSYLDVAKLGVLQPTAGAGFGVERMLRYITGVRDIADVSLFPKVPGGEFWF